MTATRSANSSTVAAQLARRRIGAEKATTGVIARLDLISDATLCTLIRAVHAELDRRDPAGAAAQARHAAELRALWEWATQDDDASERMQG